MDKSRGKRPASPYSVIIKVACSDNCNDKKCTSCDFKKYEYVRDLLKLTVYIDKHFPTWRWFNVYLRADGRQLDSFTRNRRPTTKGLHY